MVAGVIIGQSTEYYTSHTYRPTQEVAESSETGPATVIRAIAAGKVVAANIDEYLGYKHIIKSDVEVPNPRLANKPPHGRINTLEREACERKCDFDCIECGMSWPAAEQESARCLRCDHFGYGIFKGGRREKW